MAYVVTGGPFPGQRRELLPKHSNLNDPAKEVIHVRRLFPMLVGGAELTFPVYPPCSGSGADVTGDPHK